MNRYVVRFEPSGRSWLLSGPVGARGRLLFTTGRDAVSHARWAARQAGGTIEVFDPQGKPFKTIEIEADETINQGYVLPSV